MDTALDRLEDGEICRLFVKGKEIEAAWWPQMNGWVYHTPMVTRTISHDEVDEWMPAWEKY